MNKFENTDSEKKTRKPTIPKRPAERVKNKTKKIKPTGDNQDQEENK